MNNKYSYNKGKARDCQFLLLIVKSCKDLVCDWVEKIIYLKRYIAIMIN
jgi:hypothetical protein